MLPELAKWSQDNRVLLGVSATKTKPELVAALGAKRVAASELAGLMKAQKLARTLPSEPATAAVVDMYEQTKRKRECLDPYFVSFRSILDLRAQQTHQLLRIDAKGSFVRIVRARAAKQLPERVAGAAIAHVGWRPDRPRPTRGADGEDRAEGEAARLRRGDGCACFAPKSCPLPYTRQAI